MKKGTAITVGFLGLIAAFSVIVISTGSKYECEVCIFYNGFEVCQKVEGMAKMDTVQTGISTACAGAANGRTESMECGQTPPVSVQCKEL